MNSGLSLLLLFVASAAAQEAAALPGPAAAAAAVDKYETNVCLALVDVCDGGFVPTSPEHVKNLRCSRERRQSSTCTFELADRKCRARFVRSSSAPHGWVVAFNRRSLMGSEVKCG